MGQPVFLDELLDYDALVKPVGTTRVLLVLTCARNVMVRHDVVESHRPVLLHPVPLLWRMEVDVAQRTHHGRFSLSYGSSCVAFPFPFPFAAVGQFMGSLSSTRISSSLSMVDSNLMGKDASRRAVQSGRQRASSQSRRERSVTRMSAYARRDASR